MEQQSNLKNIIEDIFYESLDFAPLDKDKILEIKANYSAVKQSLIESAKKRKMMPFVACLMVELNLDREYWESVLCEYRTRNSVAKEQLNDVFAALKVNGIEQCYPIENFAALLTSDTDIAMFASGDVDIYAGHADHDAIHRVMTGLGYDRTVFNEYQGYYYKKEDLPVGINMMWMWQSRKNMPFHTAFDQKNLRGGYKENIPLLPADELMYMCLLHASVHRYICSPGIKLYYDIGLLAETGVNWHSILRFAEEDGYLTRIKISALCASRFLHIPIPQWVFQASDYEKERNQRILGKLQDKEGHFIKDVTALRLMQIEAFSDDVSLVHKGLQILFPEPEWIRKKYTVSLPLGYLRNILSGPGG